MANTSPDAMLFRAAQTFPGARRRSHPNTSPYLAQFTRRRPSTSNAVNSEPVAEDVEMVTEATRAVLRRCDEKVCDAQQKVPSDQDHAFDGKHDAATCSICRDSAAICCAEPCHHIYSCVKCAAAEFDAAVESGRSPRCAFCRSSIERFFRVYVIK